MKLEAGKYYKTRDGRKVGPAEYEGGAPSPWNVPSEYGSLYFSCDGRICTYHRDGDIIAEWTDDETPKLWRDMTPEEKGALLLAHHEGKVIENTLNGGKSWSRGNPYWADGYAYRIKPEPKVETVVMSGHTWNNGWYFDTHRKEGRPTHRITLTIRDGKVDPVAQVEEL